MFEKKAINLEDLGFSNYQGTASLELDAGDLWLARVIAEYQGAYRVRTTDNEYRAKITGKQRYTATSREDYPAVGDWVVISPLNEEQAVINKILPRKRVLRKKQSNKQEAQVIATNIDVAFIVEAVDRDYNLNRLERYVILARDGNIEPVIVLHKIDLLPAAQLQTFISQIADRFKDLKVIAISTLTQQGLTDLKNAIVPGNTYCFLGSSGVGKSSLINQLLGQDLLRTSEIMEQSGRGKHTTTTRQMYFLDKGGMVIDTPGMREVGLVETTEALEDVFAEINSWAPNCKYDNCAHLHEPGCSVKQAVADKKLDAGKYENYLKLKKESDFYAMTELEKRRKDQKFGRFLKKAITQKKTHKP